MTQLLCDIGAGEHGASMAHQPRPDVPAPLRKRAAGGRSGQRKRRSGSCALRELRSTVTRSSDSIADVLRVARAKAPLVRQRTGRSLCAYDAPPASDPSSEIASARVCAVASRSTAMAINGSIASAGRQTPRLLPQRSDRGRGNLDRWPRQQGNALRPDQPAFPG